MKIKTLFLRLPVLTTLLASLISGFFVSLFLFLIKKNTSSDFTDAFAGMLFYVPISAAAILTVENIIFLFIKQTPALKKTVTKLEIFGIVIGFAATEFVLLLSDISYSDWSSQLYNNTLHSPVDPNTYPTLFVIGFLAFAGYAYLRFFPVNEQPPLMTVISLALVYLGCGECIIWCVQVFSPDNVLFILFPINYIVISLRMIRSLVLAKAETPPRDYGSGKLGKLSAAVEKAGNLPLVSLLCAIPVLGIIIAVLALFGQVPDSIIKAWTNTADWNLSKMTPPPNVYKDEHYLCTVAAGGHEKIVKPLRTGTRHGHTVMVNRQLCIANAFEQLISERAPDFHRFIRSAYDKLGYPIAKHIRTKTQADVIYFIMKPLEIFFLAVLYLFDAHPENRIAVQYPHAPVPDVKL